MIVRNYRVIDLANGTQNIAIECEGENLQTLNMYLNSDVRPFEDFMKSAFDKVLSGEEDSMEVGGNVCCAVIHPDTTKVYDTLADTDEAYEASCSEVDTKELRELIEEWCDKVREFTQKLPY